MFFFLGAILSATPLLFCLYSCSQGAMCFLDQPMAQGKIWSERRACDLCDRWPLGAI